MAEDHPVSQQENNNLNESLLSLSCLKYEQLQKKKNRCLEVGTFSISKQKVVWTCYALSLQYFLKFVSQTEIPFADTLLMQFPLNSYLFTNFHHFKYKTWRSKRHFFFQNEIWPSFQYASLLLSVLPSWGCRYIEKICKVSRRITGAINILWFGIISSMYLTWEQWIINPNYLQGLTRKPYGS